ncbi:9875_t:CDS:1, partial [Gigaspora rosea]
EFIYVIYDDETLENENHTANDDINTFQKQSAYTKEVLKIKTYNKNILKKPYTQKIQKKRAGYHFKDESKNELKKNINNAQQNANALFMEIINEKNERIRNGNFVNTTLSSYNVKNRSLTERRLLADLEINRLLNKL